ncbi:MAG: hypothetical protein COW59_01045, partial [Lysobacterales bacterium CG17_big_fil_post_rev_8_21_14_2_50_64_11]
MLSRHWLLISLLLLAGCAGTATRGNDAVVSQLELRLSPASLGHELALQQQLIFSFRKSLYAVDALLEVDAGEVRLAVQSLGRSVLRLHWNGIELKQHRSADLPASLRGETVLSDLQLSYWPIAVIRSALPESWSVSEVNGVRRVYRDGREVVAVHYLSPQRIEIVRPHSDSRLTV